MEDISAGRVTERWSKHGETRCAPWHLRSGDGIMEQAWCTAQAAESAPVERVHGGSGRQLVQPAPDRHQLGD